MDSVIDSMLMNQCVMILSEHLHFDLFLRSIVSDSLRPH